MLISSYTLIRYLIVFRFERTSCDNTLQNLSCIFLFGNKLISNKPQKIVHTSVMNTPHLNYILVSWSKSTLINLAKHLFFVRNRLIFIHFFIDFTTSTSGPNNKRKLFPQNMDLSYNTKTSPMNSQSWILHLVTKDFIMIDWGKCR